MYTDRVKKQSEVRSFFGNNVFRYETLQQLNNLITITQISHYKFF